MAGPPALETIQQAVDNIANAEMRSGRSEAEARGRAWRDIRAISGDSTLTTEQKIEKFKMFAGEPDATDPVQGSGS